MTELAYNILWSWEPLVRALFRRLDPPLWRECGYNPVLMLGRVSQATLQRAGNDPRYLSLYRMACEAYDARVRKAPAAAGRQADRLLLRGVRAYRVPAGLFGRPRDPLRRPPEVVQRPGLSADRSGSAVPAGLLPPESQSRRMAAGTLSDERFLYPAARAGEGRRRPGSEGHGQAADRAGLHSGLEARRRPDHAVPARHQHSGKPAAAGPRHHRLALRRRYRYAHPAGDRARHRRHARAEGDGPQAHRLPHERGALGVSRAGADPAVHARRAS